MNNGDYVRNLNNKQLSEFMAEERYRIAKPIFDYFGYGITKEFLAIKIFSWLEEKAD